MTRRTRVELGRREDLGADGANCFGLCCVALAFAKSSDFPFYKPAGDPCPNLAADDACAVHSQLRDRGFKGCTVFDCFGAGQKVSRHTFGGRSWRDAAPSRAAFDTVQQLSDGSAEEVQALDVRAHFDAARELLVEASEIARAGHRPAGTRPAPKNLGPGCDLMGARLPGADLRGMTLRGAVAIAADLSGATLTRCDVLGVDMRDADLRGANLDGAIYLTQMQVNSARGDSATRLPDGFQRPSHW